MSLRLRAATLAAVLLLAGAAGATPAVEQQLKRARSQYNDQEYQQVVGLTVAVLGTVGASVDQKVEANELLGLSQLILGRDEQARQAFTRLLRLRPGHRLRDPSGSPKLRSFFAAVKRAMPLTEAAVLRLSSPPAARAGSRLLLRASMRGVRWQGHRALLRWRRGGELTWQAVRARRQGGDKIQAALLLPASGRAYMLEYYLELLDAKGRRVATAGQPGRPLSARVAATRRASGGTSLVRKWWFWVAVGAVVVGGTTAGIVALSNEEAPRGNLQPGVVRLR